jgi:hypothetical protein
MRTGGAAARTGAERREDKADAHVTSCMADPSNCNSFSVLPVEEIAHVTSCMGIIVEDDNFATFNLIKDLEKARDDLYQKQVVMNQKPQTESVEECQENNENLAIEWLNEESSKTGDFILVESR